MVRGKWKWLKWDTIWVIWAVRGQKCGSKGNGKDMLVVFCMYVCVYVSGGFRMCVGVCDGGGLHASVLWTVRTYAFYEKAYLNFYLRN